MQELMNNLIFQHPLIILAISLLVFLDLITGIFKSKTKGIATKSQGFKKTVNKLISYLSLIILSFIVTNISNSVWELKTSVDTLGLGLDTIGLFLVYLEIKSILENLIVANTNKNGEQNDFAKLLVPIHNALILKFNKQFNYEETKKELTKKINGK